MNLYQITTEYQSLLNNLADPETGEINDSAFNELEALTDKMENKGIAIASFIKNLDAEKKAVEDAKKSMAEREARLNNRISSLTSYLQTNMERCGISEISCPNFVIKLKQCPFSVDITDENAISEEYKRRKETISVDKAKILSQLKAGGTVEGATLKRNIKLEIK